MIVQFYLKLFIQFSGLDKIFVNFMSHIYESDNILSEVELFGFFPI